MSKCVELNSDGDRILRRLSQKTDFSGAPIQAMWTPRVDYEAVAAYLRAHGEEALAWMRDHLADDELRPLARALWAYIRTKESEDR
jgi:hypothetical protein